MRCMILVRLPGSGYQVEPVTGEDIHKPMSDFIEAALGLPAIVFSFLLVVVVGYWVLVLLGGVEVDALDADVDAGGGFDGLAGFVAGIGLGGVPVGVVLSLLIAMAWFVSLVGTVLLDGADLAAPVLIVLAIAVLAVALVCAWLGTALLVLPLRRLFPDERAPSRADFVGSVCVVRTGQVGPDFGQAEVTAPDGSSAIIQVRQTGSDALGAGSTALIFDYDAAGEFFWVAPFDPALDPGRPST
jgi:hypothetical protein